MDNRRIRIVSVVLVAIGILMQFGFGPITEEYDAQSQVASGQQSSYKRFDVKNLRKDLSQYTNLTKTSLDAFATGYDPDDTNGKAYGTYVVPGLEGVQTLETANADKNTDNLINSDYMTPQGVTVTPDYIVTSAYDHLQKGASILTVTDRKTGKFVKNVILQGRPHVGGITYDPENDVIWVCGRAENKAALIAISLKDIKDYDFDKSQKAISYTHVAELPSISRASAVAYRDGDLWVGFFNPLGDSTIQRCKISDVMNDTAQFKKDVAANNNAFDGVLTSWKSQKTIGQIQGITFYKNRVYLSQSYGPEDSRLYVYKINDTQKRFTKDQAEAVVTMPSHLEQISVDGNRMYAIFESSARAYSAHEKTKIGRVVSFNVDKLPPFSGSKNNSEED